MRRFHRKEEIHEALAFLGKQMALAYAEDLRLLCCGGSGLCVLEILSRPTKDVDALALIADGEVLRPIEGFSPDMERAIAQTAQTLGLDGDWLNGEASILLQRGLPEGILTRSISHTRQYGPCLTVQFIDRLDQVALKLYAAMDPLKGRRHEEDLVEIRPSRREIEHALKWLGGWKSNDAFRKRLAFLIIGDVNNTWDGLFRHASGGRLSFGSIAGAAAETASAHPSNGRLPRRASASAEVRIRCG